ncbi:uncharacterized protein TrAtP1_002915 [Trichoderma atroviride]|uniref:uncharacterized protein n=1 Tax=Hypocrea atroviridis TaxID=63577 RepID=UPI00331D2DBB|nr:hypothetical protein TrAtP1_002915 [Trichoderma atroviride]
MELPHPFRHQSGGADVVVQNGAQLVVVAEGASVRTGGSVLRACTKIINIAIAIIIFVVAIVTAVAPTVVVIFVVAVVGVGVGVGVGLVVAIIPHFLSFAFSLLRTPGAGRTMTAGGRSIEQRRTPSSLRVDNGSRAGGGSGAESRT